MKVFVLIDCDVNDDRHAIGVYKTYDAARIAMQNYYDNHCRDDDMNCHLRREPRCEMPREYWYEADGVEFEDTGRGTWFVIQELEITE